MALPLPVTCEQCWSQHSFFVLFCFCPWILLNLTLCMPVNFAVSAWHFFTEPDTFLACDLWTLLKLMLSLPVKSAEHDTFFACELCCMNMTLSSPLIVAEHNTSFACVNFAEHITFYACGQTWLNLTFSFHVNIAEADSFLACKHCGALHFLCLRTLQNVALVPFPFSNTLEHWSILWNFFGNTRKEDTVLNRLHISHSSLTHSFILRKRRGSCLCCM